MCLPSRKSLTGNTVLYAVQEKLPNPKLLPGEDVFLDEKVPPLPSMSRLADCAPLFLGSSFFLLLLRLRLVHTNRVHEMARL